MQPRNEAEQFERIPTRIFKGADAACQQLAAEIDRLIRRRAEEGKPAVLGLATGSTPVRLYRELIRRHREEGLSFANVVTFNLDEYHGLERTHPESYWQFMWEQLFAHVDIREENVHLPSGTVPRGEAFGHCREYEEAIAAAGGIEIQILGIGRTGHIGFNEPGSGADSRTRLVTLDSLTRRDAARDFRGEANVPRHAITMGVGTILEAKRIVLLAWGEAKAGVIAPAVEEAPSANLPASFLQQHGDVRFFLDEAAASGLIRQRHPWRVGPVDWTPRLRRQAVVWLSQTVGKPVLKLTDEQYGEHQLADLITAHGPAYNLNIRIFNELQHTITGWPGGKPNADDTYRPERAEPARKRVLVLSPEPSDAETAIGGTLHRLVDQGHEVTLAFLTSGNLAVPDPQARLATDLVLEMSSPDDEESAVALARRVRGNLDGKGPFEADSSEVRRLKGLLRRGESRAAAEICGLAPGRCVFLDLPFYEEGRYRQFVLGQVDIERLTALLREHRPHQVYVGGSLADPNSVAAVGFEAFRRAAEGVRAEEWWTDCFVWLYRTGQRVWPVHEIDMAVPLSPSEMANKLEAIYRHQSQRSQSPVGGGGGNEPWQQAEHLNRETADAYDALGLPEYEAIETFHRWTSA
ncbi:MAG: glucosamine-6-phosphate deaminase [Verrucomicrobiota bacterium]